jgi:rare lipoprotein A
VLAAAVTLPLSGPVHADADLVPAAPVYRSVAVIQPLPEVFPEPTGISVSDDAEGSRYTPIPGGMASYYGKAFAGRPTASGERFDPAGLTAAHRTLPMGSLVRVTNPANGQSVTVRINDRGPFHGNRVIDLSRAAADSVGIVRAGRGRVELALVEA